ncbi:MAG: hypothetical protein V7703_15590 [Hyphomicrobiales bacterium]
MKKIAIVTAALLVTANSAFAGHPHVGDAARTSDNNQSGKASAGWDKLSTNASDGKAAAASDKR